MRGQALFLCVAATAAGCAQNAGVDTAAEAAVIRQRFAAWIEAETHRDMNASLSYMAPDIVIQPEGAPAITGLEGARELYKGFFALPYTAISDVEPRTVLVARSGDLASDIGNWKVTLSGANGPAEQRGKSAIVWQKRDGHWVAISMTFSMDAPQEAAPPAKP